MGHFFLAYPSTFLQQPAAGAARAASSRVASSQEAGSRQPVVSSQDSASTTTTSRAVSDDTLGSFWSLFPGSSVRQCHGVFPSGTYVFAAASGRSSQSSQQQRVASSQEASSRQPVVSIRGASLVYKAVSDDTLGSFGSLFPGPSVLQCHGVFPSGTCGFAAASGRSS